jgi:hypothetical protein
LALAVAVVRRAVMLALAAMAWVENMATAISAADKNVTLVMCVSPYGDGSRQSSASLCEVRSALRRQKQTLSHARSRTRERAWLIA